ASARNEHACFQRTICELKLGKKLPLKPAETLGHSARIIQRVGCGARERSQERRPKPARRGSCRAVSASAGVPVVSMVVQLSPPRERWPTQAASRRLEAGRNYAVLRAARRKSDQPQSMTAGSRGRAR